MNYQKHYDALIDRARNREQTGYTEKHHVVPRCLNGTDDDANLVRLTASEHFVAHQLLVKIYPDNHKLVYALNAMLRCGPGQHRTNKRYSWIKRTLAHTYSQRVPWNKGIKTAPRSAETKEKISKSNIKAGRRPPSQAGKIMSEEQKNNIRLSRTPEKEKVRVEKYRATCALRKQLKEAYNG